MPKELTREQFISAAAKPKRRFQALALGASRRVRLGKAVATPCYWFERHEEIIDEGGKYTVDPNQATVTLVVDGAPSVLFYLEGSRLESCTFAFNLNAQQLGKAVAAMKRAKLTRLIPAAASSALENMPEARRALLEADLRVLLGKRREGSGRRK